VKTYSITQQGRARDHNQDQFFVRELADGSVLLAVFDGVGGQTAGEQAAHLAKESLDDFNPHSQGLERHLVKLMQVANQKILDRVEKDPDLWGMGTTMTVAFANNGVAHWAHVGDSRLYHFSRDHIDQITEDDTIPGLLLSDGEITKEEARVHPNRNFLFEFIGCGKFELHAGTFGVGEGDFLLLSTDGFHDQVPEEVIVSILQSDDDLEGKVQMLISTALNAGGKDDITVIGAEV